MNYQGAIGRLVITVRATTSWNYTAYNIWFNSQVSLLLFSLAVWVFAKKICSSYSIYWSLCFYFLCVFTRKKICSYMRKLALFVSSALLVSGSVLSLLLFLSEDICYIYLEHIFLFTCVCWVHLDARKICICNPFFFIFLCSLYSAVTWMIHWARFFEKNKESIGCNLFKLNSHLGELWKAIKIKRNISLSNCYVKIGWSFLRLNDSQGVNC